MKKILIITHSLMAKGIKETVEFLAGSQNIDFACCFTDIKNPDVYLDEYLKYLSKDDKLIIFTDLKGGSVNQKASMRLKKDNFYLITGVNLPIVLEVLFANEESINKDYLKGLIEKAKEEIVLMNEIINNESENESLNNEEFFLERKEDNMIYLRLDERLLHGQVTTTWIRYLGISHIIICDDEVVNDKNQCNLLKMSVPDGVKMVIKSVDKTTSMLNDERCKNIKILVICANLENVMKLVENCKEIKDVNLANYGFQSDMHSKTNIMLTSNLSVNEEEREIVKKLIANKDLDVYCQVLANQTRKIINV